MNRPRVVQHGFTLLEAIVALSILAMSAMALYGWLNSNLLLLQRVDNVYQGLEAVDSALEWVTVLDPFEQPEGSQNVAGALVSWRFVPLGSSRPARDMNANLSVNDVQLFRLEVEVQRDEQRLARFETLQLGLQQKRTADQLIF